MNSRNNIFAAVLVALLAVMLLERDSDLHGPLPTEHSPRPPRPTPEGTAALPPAKLPENSVTQPAAINAVSAHPTNPVSPPRGLGPVVMPATSATEHTASTNNNAVGARVSAVVPDPSITPPPTPVMPLPVELKRTESPVVPPGRDRPYSGP